MAVTVVKAPAGLGKTRAVAAKIAHDLRISEVYVPTRRLAEEWRDNILSSNPRKRVQVIYGRSAPIPVAPVNLQPASSAVGCASPAVARTCAQHRLADQLSKAGYPVLPNLCIKPGASGQSNRCVHFDGCYYINQFQHAEVRIYVHAHLATERHFLDDGKPGIVVIDESFFQSLIEQVTYPLALLTDQRLPQITQGLCQALGTVMQTGAPIENCIDAAIASQTRFTALTEALRAGNLVSPRTVQLLPALLKKAPNFEPVRKTIEQLVREYKARGTAQSVTYDANTGNVTLHHRKQITRFETGAAAPDIYILDASASEEVVRPFFPGATFKTMAVERNAYVMQCCSTTCSTTSLVPARNGNPKSAARAGGRLTEVQSLVQRHARNGRKVLVVGPSAVVGNPASNQAPLFTIPTHCEFAHFNAVRGVDRWKHFNTIIVIGRNQPAVDEVENIARALFHDDPQPLYLPGQWDSQIRGYRLRHGKQGVKVDVHPDARVQAVLEQIRECESTQAIDRLRLVHSPDTKLV